MAKSAKFTLERVCGYCRPVNSFNKGKREEFKERKKFDSFLNPKFDGRSIFEKEISKEKENILKSSE